MVWCGIINYLGANVWHGAASGLTRDRPTHRTFASIRSRSMPSLRMVLDRHFAEEIALVLKSASEIIRSCRDGCLGAVTEVQTQFPSAACDLTYSRWVFCLRGDGGA